MEFKLETVRSLDEIETVLKRASSEKHHNSNNYLIDNLKKRWKNYVLFQKLTDVVMGGVIAISGLYRYNPRLARVCDRTWIDPVYRNQYLNKKNDMAIRPIIDYFVPTHTKYCLDNDIVPFISVQYPSRTKVLERVARETALGYELLDGLFFTCHHDNHDSTNCWHRVISIGDTGLVRKTTDEVDSIHERRVNGGVDLSGV